MNTNTAELIIERIEPEQDEALKEVQSARGAGKTVKLTEEEVRILLEADTQVIPDLHEIMVAIEAQAMAEIQKSIAEMQAAVEIQEGVSRICAEENVKNQAETAEATKATAEDTSAAAPTLTAAAAENAAENTSATAETNSAAAAENAAEANSTTAAETIAEANSATAADTTVENTSAASAAITSATAIETTSATETASAAAAVVPEPVLPAAPSVISAPPTPVAVPATKRKKSKLPFIVIPLLAAVGIATGVYLKMSEKYQTVFFDNTFINGVNVSGMTAAEADAAVSAKGEPYALTVQFRDGSTETITGEDIDYGYHAAADIEEALAGQVPVRWLMENNAEHNFEAELIPGYSEDRLEAAIAAFPELKAENMTAPTDAYVTIEDNHFTVVPETQGNMFDVAGSVEAIRQAVSNYDEALDLSALDLYCHPGIDAAAAAQIGGIDELNRLLSPVITYELGEQPSILDASVLITWLSVDENGRYYKNEEVWNEKIHEYVNSIAAIVAGYPNVWQFNATGLGPITIEGGTYPRAVNIEAECAELAQLLADGATATRTPIMSNADGDQGNFGLGGTYVEIDLSRQYLWAYDHGQLYMETPIVSGRMTHDRYSEPGVYYVYFKQQNRILRGEVVDYTDDGAPIYQYEAPVSYWMAFNDAAGMHDASWQAAFGGNWYLLGGSRGCINMPVDQAPLMYQWVTSEMPVVLYYSEPMQFVD